MEKKLSGEYKANQGKYHATKNIKSCKMWELKKNESTEVVKKVY